MEIFLLFDAVGLGLDLNMTCPGDHYMSNLSDRVRENVNTLFSNTTADIRCN